MQLTIEIDSYLLTSSYSFIQARCGPSKSKLPIQPTSLDFYIISDIICSMKHILLCTVGRCIVLPKLQQVFYIGEPCLLNFLHAQYTGDYFSL